MKTYFILVICFLGAGSVLAQEIDPDLQQVRAQMNAIEAFSAEIELSVDIDFINMPVKHAKMEYRKGKPVQFNSEDFVLIPKRGLDFSMDELFKYPVITVDRGMETRDGKDYKMINVIPNDKRADFSIATLLIDVKLHRIAESEISTKKDGTYLMKMTYQTDRDLLPSRIEVGFEIEKIRIPLNYMGKEAEIDKEALNTEGPKEGKIILEISNYKIESI